MKKHEEAREDIENRGETGMRKGRRGIEAIKKDEEQEGKEQMKKRVGSWRRC